MNKYKTFLVVAALLALITLPTFAQEGAEAGAVDWGILGAGFAIGVAAAGCGIGQGRATSAALSGMARNPGAAGNIRTTLIIGLALIESLVIYALVIALRGAGFF